MKTFRLKATYKDFLDALIASGKRVAAPVSENGQKIPLRFGIIASSLQAADPDEYVNTIRPAKEFMFPMSEPLLEFSYRNKEISVTDALKKPEELVIAGLRPCDAAAFKIIDDIFSYVYKDEFYFSRREKTTIVGVACGQSDEACFCTTAGLDNTSPEGSDLFLVKTNDGEFMARAMTGKGESLAVELRQVLQPAEDEYELNDAYAVSKDKIRPRLDVENIRKGLKENFDSPYWEHSASNCLGCASCAYLCPTCHCFDIVDEMKYDKGIRRKNWDACQTPLFTRHASGHNPREIQSKRYRQRVMHKFSYYNERFEKLLCTGCGRCIRSCPANIDIYEIVCQVHQARE